MPFVMTRPSYVDESLFGSNHVVAKARLAVAAANPEANAGVISGGDLERIKSSTLGSERSAAAGARAQRQEALRAMSLAKTAKWPNTIEAIRKKKEASRRERLDAEEALRVAIDKEEESFKAEKRRLAIERANKMLYDQTDRVKALHTRMHMAELDAARAEQIAFKEAAKQRERERETMWHEQQKDMLRKMDADEDARDAEDFARRMEERRLREAQVALKHAEYADKLATIKREGELMRQKAADDLRKEREMEAQRMATEAAAREESLRLNDFLKEQKKEQARKEAEEEARMRRYAIAKEESLLARRKREEERFDAKQQVRQRMIDAQVERLARMQATTDTRMQRQVEELESQVREAERARHEKARADLIATHISRQQQLKWRADAKQQAELEQQHYASQLGELNARLRKEELQKMQGDRKERERLDDYLFDQMAERQAKELHERQEEVEEAEHIRQFLSDEEAIFQQYAQMCIDELKDEGKTTKPIELLLSKKHNLAD